MEINFGLIFTLLLLLVQMGLGAYVLLRTTRNQISFSFALFCFSLFLWAFPSYMLQISKTLPQFEFWQRYLFLGPVLIAYFFLYFSFVFPQGEIIELFSILLLAPTVLFLVLIPSSLIFNKEVIAATGPIPVWGPAFAWFVFYFLSYVFWGIYNLVKKYWISKGAEKNQVKYVLTGLFLTFFFAVISSLVLPLFGIDIFANIGPFFTLIFIGVTFYTIVKHRLMDISVIISRTASEVIAFLVYGAIYLALVWFYLTYVTNKIDLPFVTLTIVYGILFEQSHRRLRISFQTTSDKLFLRGKYDYYKTLSDVSSRAGEKLSLPEILRVLYETFHEVVEISNPRIFLPEYFVEAEKSSTRYLVYDKETCFPQEEGQAIKMDSPLVNQLIAKRDVMHEVKDINAALVVPCLLEDRLIAIFVLGPKLSEEPFTDEDMRLLKVLANQAAISLDHTRSYEKIKADLESIEHQLERSQRLASLGTLTAGVAHEIRNPLTVIRAETERLANESRDLEYLKQFQGLMLKHIDRISNIMQRMLSLAKDRAKRQVPVNLTELLDSTIQLFSLGRVKAVKDLTMVPDISGDPEELQEALVNLFQNAIDAMMPEGGTLTLRTYLENRRVVMEVSDTGHGIPEEIRERIFDPFYSTKREGLGLGLSITYRIIREHGGDIILTSEVGKGTKFKIMF